MRRITIDKLEAGMIAREDVYVPDSIVPIVHKDTELSSHMIDMFRIQGIQRVLVDIPGEVHEEPPPKIKPLIDDQLRTEAIDGIRKMFTVVSEGTEEENMTTAFQAVKEIGNVVDQLVDTLSAETNALIHIADIKSYDDYTYHHSLSVAVLSIAIGQSLHLHDDELKTLGRSAMMHDIGKTLVPVEIINKPGRLTDEEFKIIQGHPQLGYDYMLKMNIGDEHIWPGVLMHHEKLDGAGYPGHRKGEEIPFVSRVVAIADVYDAVTSYRSYRRPMPPSDAIELIMSEAGFDYDIVSAFIEKIEPYPINTIVELSNGKKAVVVDCENSKRPVVKIADSGDMIDLMDIKNLNLVITRVVTDE